MESFAKIAVMKFSVTKIALVEDPLYLVAKNHINLILKVKMLKKKSVKFDANTEISSIIRI